MNWKQFVPNIFLVWVYGGELVLATTKALPGDTSKEDILNLVVNAIEMSGVTRVSQAHAAFLKAYCPLVLEE